MLKSHSYTAQVIDDIRDYRKNGVSQSGSTFLRRNFGSDILETNNNPNYQVNIVRHVDAGSPYRRRKDSNISLLVANGDGRVFNDATSEYTGYISLMPSTFGLVDYTSVSRPDLDEHKNQALRRVKNKLATRTKKVQSLVSIAEVRELGRTYTSMCSLTTQFLIGVLTARRRLLKNPKRAVRDFSEFLSEAWLTYSFGISPTVADFENHVEAVVSRLSRTQTLRESGIESADFFGSAKQSIYLAGNFPAGISYALSVDVSANLRYKLTYSYTCGRYIDLGSASSGLSVSDQFGLNWSDIIPAAYELVPFSWLLDYFTTAGDFVNDVFESPSGNTIYNYLTVFQESELTSSASINYGRNFRGMGSISSVPHVKCEIVRRTRLAQLPHQSLRIKTSNEITANLTNRLLNLFALAQPIFGRTISR